MSINGLNPSPMTEYLTKTRIAQSEIQDIMHLWSNMKSYSTDKIIRSRLEYT